MASTIDMSKHFTFKDLLVYTAPSMAMMLFTSIYVIVDGFFVSNFAGKTAFAAVNLIMPFITILGTVGFMVGTGGGALVAQARGEGDAKKANRWFSLIVWFALISGIVLAIFGALLMEPVTYLFGADDAMVSDCVLYGRVSMISLPFYILQFAFQSLFNTAGKPGLGFGVTVASGLMNIVLDFVLVGFLGMGVLGAAAATVCSELVGGIVPLVYFLAPNSSYLRLGRCALNWHVIAKTCINGSSEMMTNIAMSVVGILYNLQLMSLLGEDGVSAYGVIMYVAWIFGAVLMGYTVGAAPLMSYQHGASNNVEKRSLFRKSLLIMVVGGIIACILAQIFIPAMTWAYTGYDQGLYELTVHAFRIYVLSFCLMGFSIYASSLFTALGNGGVSAFISFMRTLVFECASVMLLPMLFGAEGIWYSVVVAEVAACILAAICIRYLGGFYGLFKETQN